jgi:signal transduction histidine kinase
MMTMTKRKSPIEKLELHITEMELMDQVAELTRKNQYLQKMVDAAHQEAQRNKRQIDALRHYNSHQVRSILSRIWGMAYVLKFSKTMEEVKDMSDILISETQAMDEVVRKVNTKLIDMDNNPDTEIIV